MRQSRFNEEQIIGILRVLRRRGRTAMIARLRWYDTEAAMQTQNRILDDMARLAGGTLGVFAGLRAEIDALVKQQMQRLLGDMDLVTREEFEAVKAMAAKAREEQDVLAERLAQIEERLRQATKDASRD